MSNKKQQTGGEYVGEGMTGCIFRPHLKCINVSNKRNSVGKVFGDNDEYDNELQMTRIVARIDPHGEFTVPVISSCDSLHYYRHNDEVSKCKLMTNDRQPNEYKQIIYKYGGTSLQKLMTKHKGSISRFIKLFTRLEPIMQGIKKFNTRTPNAPNVVHLDIKPHNILSLRSKLYLIDFGLLSAHDEIYTKNTTNILTSDYPWYPPEFKVFLFPTKGNFITLFKRVQDNFVNVEPYIANAIVTTLHVDVKHDLERFFNDKVPKKDFNQYASKIDIYALGIVLLQLFLWSGYHNKRYSRPSKYSSIRGEITELIKGMICFDPRQRYTIEQALEHFRRIKQHLDT